MTSYEIVRRAVEFDGPERIPIRFPSLGLDDTYGVGPKAPDGWAPCQACADEWGVVWTPAPAGITNLGQPHLAARAQGPNTVLRHEDALLDTGGGVRAACDLLGADPFFVVNGDAFWLDGPTPALRRLARAWNAAAADAVLLVNRTCQTQAETGPGDFALDPMGFARRRREREIVPYIYAGIQLIAPALLAEAPAGPFSMNLAWNRAMAAGRLRAVVHDGWWFHLSTPSDLFEAEASLYAQRTGDSR